jgi:hypothetical protein
MGFRTASISRAVADAKLLQEENREIKVGQKREIVSAFVRWSKTSETI